MKLLSILALALTLCACSTAYYNTMEKFGVHKRNIMIDRVEEARDAQKDGQEQFESALAQFKSVVSVDGGELEKTYNTLNREYEDSFDSAEEIRKRIDSVESVAEDLFDEWEEELDRYSSDTLRRDSERKLESTRQQYSQLIGLMRVSEERLDPVLQAMEDQVLFLKHNLNTQAIASLQEEAVRIDDDVGQLIDALRKSIAEADSFIQTMRE
ncbi:DUF2959 domain-containing protein [Marinimicrobium sp. C2-29]|uniref:DUF2959 domain-containing protein n=1 Tax=Marinimicrobium sp. C2-29 TaxID=3139825 RepID=UPI00313890CB